jgi:hypothetical protein
LSENEDDEKTTEDKTTFEDASELTPIDTNNIVFESASRISRREQYIKDAKVEDTIKKEKSKDMKESKCSD